MEKSTVTRTTSFRAICNGTKPVHSDDFSTAHRRSSTGRRALMWATSSVKSFGSSLGSDSQTSRDNIFTNILTPDSIPQFTVPSLSVHVGLRSSRKSKDRQTEDDDAETDEGLGTELESCLSVSSASCSLSSSASSFSLPLSDRKAERSVSDPLTQGRSLLKRDASLPSAYRAAQDCLDPASRAALSLPHLTKVTTPYGFVTLSQSPQMASEEALLCQVGLRRLNKDEEPTCFYRKAPLTRTADISVRGSSSHRTEAKQRLSKNLSNSQAEGLPKGMMNTATTASPTTKSASCSSTPKQSTDSKRKHRFGEVIRKQFTSHHKE